MNDDLILLEDDRQYAKRRIAELEKQIQDLGPEFYEVFNQSSETWHDNAPFDALRDRQSVLDAELQSLKRMLRSSLPSVPRQKKGIVGIGSTVFLSDERTYLIAGDWTPYAGAKTKDGAFIVSKNTPAAAALLGKKEGDQVVVAGKQFTIQKIKTLG